MANKAAEADGPSISSESRTDESATFTTALPFDTESGKPLSPPKRQSIATTASLAKAFVRAARASANGTQEPPLTFGSLLVAMLVDEDQWLRRHFDFQEMRFDQITAHRPYSEESLRTADPRDLAPKYLATTSARAALEEATRIARLPSGATVVGWKPSGPLSLARWPPRSADSEARLMCSKPTGRGSKRS